MYLDTLYIPSEIVLHICMYRIHVFADPCSSRNTVSYLDLPDLASISQISPLFATLAADPALHHVRLRITAPSRVKHSLFGRSPAGYPLRPTIPDLVRRGVMRGLNVERRWRMGAYLSSQSVRSTDQ